MKTQHIAQLTAGLAIAASSAAVYAFTPSQQPAETKGVPGNVVLALSVEFPTATQASYTTPTYTITQRYEGYFDNRKCYAVRKDETKRIPEYEVFRPVSAQSTATGGCPDPTQWAGNLLNWLTMANLDQFRSVMTGGNRDVDDTSRTVLVRTFGSDQGNIRNNPIRSLTIGTPGLPITGTPGATWYARSFGYGSKVIFSDTNNLRNFNESPRPNQKSRFDMSASEALEPCSKISDLDGRLCRDIRVEVCIAVPGVGLEANCQDKYSGVPKPEGLIQKYKNDMRFAALGYLNNNDRNRNGAVLRSAMKSVGPVAATAGGSVPNPAPEWDTATGIMFANPDAADALASGVTNSGLMNYLNKFGYSSGSYKTYDNVSELYYASQLYLRGRKPPDDYTNNLTDALRDGFPVIVSAGTELQRSGSRDPILQSCQKNYIVGIGDINTHCDGNLNGSTRTGCSSGTPSDQDGVNVESLFNTIRGYEGMAANGVVGVGGSDSNTPYIASLAYWANTTDIRSDLTGTQNIKTYWVDVLEAWNGSIADASKRKTQYWLATKYGGFDTTLAGTNPNTDVLSWDKDNNASPDNWFAGSNPVAMREGLSQAFAAIANDSAGSASTPAVSSRRETPGSKVFYAGYASEDWSGTLSACNLTQTSAECKASPLWEASRWFKTTAPLAVPVPLTDDTRKIFTSQRTGTFATMPFRWADLNAAQRTILDAGDGLGNQRLDYLRGKRDGEGTTFRKRPDNLLGDIVNSGVTYVEGASRAYSGAKFPNHAAYRSVTKNRPAVVYVGSNDGMLHAFSDADGKELFGYIPGSVFSKLPKLTDVVFNHQYFVDSTPMVGDFEKSSGVWGTMLLGALGAGGRGFYALDITEQSTFFAPATTEVDLATKLPIWEFTSVQDGDVGYSFNEASTNPITGAYQQIAKVADSSEANGVWRVLVGNGYGSNNGKAVLFMINANTGAATTKLEAYAPTAVSPARSGLSAPTPVDTDRDGLIDTVYAGDLLGNLHKFQFSKLTGADYVLAKSAEAGGAWRYLGKVYAAGEPITSAPSVVPACEGPGWNVLFGTGKLNEDADFSDTANRGFYNVLDKSPSSSLLVPTTELAVISTFSSPALGGGLVGRNWSTPNLTGKRGWKVTFTGGERVLGNATLPPDTGAILFATSKPKGDICTPGNTGFLMAVDICSGKTGSLVVNGIEVGGVSIDSPGILKVGNTVSDRFNKPKVVCNQAGCGPGGPILNTRIAPRGRYSWREILTK